MAIETEVKLRLPQGADAARALLEGLGYLPRGGRLLEADEFFDRPDGELKAGGRVLRLRSSGGVWVLTYKGPPLAGPHKSREEIEVPIEDGVAMRQLLLALGYAPSFRSEKFRTTFARAEQAGIVTLDETPMGDFLELEGPGDWIDRTTVELGFLTKDYIVISYATLYSKYQKEHPNLPPDMIFLELLDKTTLAVP